MRGYERAAAEYESRMMCPYDKGGALYVEDEDHDDGYDVYVDAQIKEALLERNEK